MKWSGSKDSQSIEIIKSIPRDLETYYEPFVGGGSIFLKLLETLTHLIKTYYISDFNKDLINIYNLIKYNPKLLIDNYKKHYNIFNSSDIKYRKEYFTKIRTEYNKYHKPEDFYWIMRTTTNGMPRYNKKNEFNNSCHFSRSGMNPSKIEIIIYKYHKLFIKDNNVVFNHLDYKKLKTNKNDFLYLDPPYENTNGMYFSDFNNKEFIEWINNLDAKWLLSYDGKVNNKKMQHNIPKYKTFKYLISGNSSFRRVIGNSNDSIVQESLYSNF